MFNGVWCMFVYVNIFVHVERLVLYKSNVVCMLMVYLSDKFVDVDI